MPSKYRKSRAKEKERHVQKRDYHNRKSHEHYEQNKTIISDQKKHHWRSDKTVRKNSYKLVKEKMQNDKLYAENNKARVQVNRRRRLTDDAYRKRYLATDRARCSLRLETDMKYYQKNKASARINTANRLRSNKEYQELNKDRARTNTVKRLELNSEYKLLNRLRANQNKKKRFLDAAYAAEFKRRARLKFNTDLQHAAKKRTVARIVRSNKNDDELRNLLVAQLNVQHSASDSTGNTRFKASKQQMYWLRRRRLLASLFSRSETLDSQQRMHQNSNVHLLDVKLQCGKAQRAINTAQCKVKKLHEKLLQKAKDCLECIPSDSVVTEPQITKVFNDLRVHSCSGEPYF